MKKTILSLGSLKAAHAAIFGKADQKEGKKSEETSEDKGDDAGGEGDGSAEEDSEEKADGESEKQEDKKADEKKATVAAADTQPKGVFLSNEDYAVVTELASEAVSLREENKGLKAKADLWESYQAALHGVKPKADTAGAKGTEEKDESKDPHADLKAKYPNLMKDI
jgi:hypothetical protein